MGEDGSLDGKIWGMNFSKIEYKNFLEGSLGFSPIELDFDQVKSIGDLGKRIFLHIASNKGEKSVEGRYSFGKNKGSNTLISYNFFGKDVFKKFGDPEKIRVDLEEACYPYDISFNYRDFVINSRH